MTEEDPNYRPSAVSQILKSLYDEFCEEDDEAKDSPKLNTTKKPQILPSSITPIRNKKLDLL